EGQAVDVVVDPHLGDADGEVDVRRVHVAQVLQVHAVGAGVAGEDVARPADADGHVRLDGLLDQEAVGDDVRLAAGVDDLQVVQPVRGVRQVEGGDDPGGVDHPDVDRRLLVDAGADQADDGVRVEAGALDGDGDERAVAAGVGVD